MSGHSKWSTIKRQKGATDIKRGQTFTKVANAITVAARALGEDPGANPKLRDAIEVARQVNMPKENIQRAIDRGLGRLPGQNLEEVVYEGFGPGNVAFLVEAVTDNKLRTSREIKNLFEKVGGSLGGQGSVSYMFDKKGEIRVKSRGGSSGDEQLELIDLGAEEVEEFTSDGQQTYLVYTDSNKLAEVSNKITQVSFEVESKELVMSPTVTVDIHDEELAKKVVEFARKLEDHQDIQRVYANFNIQQEIVERL